MTVVGSSVRMVRALGVKRATWETAGFLLSQHVLTIRNIRRIRKWEVPVTPLVKRNPVSVDPFAIQIWWVWENEKRISLALDRNTLQFAPPTHFLLFLCTSCTGSQYISLIGESLLLLPPAGVGKVRDGILYFCGFRGKVWVEKGGDSGEGCEWVQYPPRAVGGNYIIPHRAVGGG